MKWQGRERLLKRMAALPESYKAEMRPALDKGADEMVDLARRFVPKKTGALAASIDKTWGEYRPENANVRGVGAGKGGHDLAVTVHAGDARAWYAALVENGTAPHENEGKFAGTRHPGTAPQPYFFPAYRLMKKRIMARIRRAHRKAFKGQK